MNFSYDLISYSDSLMDLEQRRLHPFPIFISCIFVHQWNIKSREFKKVLKTSCAHHCAGFLRQNTDGTDRKTDTEPCHFNLVKLFAKTNFNFPPAISTLVPVFIWLCSIQIQKSIINGSILQILTACRYCLLLGFVEQLTSRYQDCLLNRYVMPQCLFCVLKLGHPTYRSHHDT